MNRVFQVGQDLNKNWKKNLMTPFLQVTDKLPLACFTYFPEHLIEFNPKLWEPCEKKVLTFFKK